MESFDPGLVSILEPLPPRPISLMSQLFCALLWGRDESKLVKGYWVKKKKKKGGWPTYSVFNGGTGT